MRLVIVWFSRGSEVESGSGLGWDGMGRAGWIAWMVRLCKIGTVPRQLFLIIWVGVLPVGSLQTDVGIILVVWWVGSTGVEAPFS